MPDRVATGAEAGAPFREDELLPVSALQHLVFCERQFALIHIEQVWVENVLTAEGRELHEQVDTGRSESRRELRIARGVPLRSLRFGLVGRSDVVELWRDDENGAAIPGLRGSWRPVPVEYKRGQPKAHRADEVQLCAQAVCLEEMLETEISGGALFYGTTRRRVEVSFDAELRALVWRAVERARELIEARFTPRARYEAKCDSCSLIELCRPKAAERSAKSYLARSLEVVDPGPDQGGSR